MPRGHEDYNFEKKVDTSLGKFSYSIQRLTQVIIILVGTVISHKYTILTNILGFQYFTLLGIITILFYILVLPS